MTKAHGSSPSFLNHPIDLRSKNESPDANRIGRFFIYHLLPQLLCDHLFHLLYIRQGLMTEVGIVQFGIMTILL